MDEDRLVGYRKAKFLEFVVENGERLPWSWRGLSWSNLVSMDLVLRFPKNKWNWDLLSENSSISVDAIITHASSFPWTWSRVSGRPDLKWDHVAENLHLPWAWPEISKHPCVTLEVVRRHPHLPWSAPDLCKSACTGIGASFDDCDDENYWRCLSYEISRRIVRNCLTFTRLYIDIVRNNIDRHWDFNALSQSSKAFLELAIEFPDKAWDWHALSFAYSSVLRAWQPREWRAAITIQRWWLTLYYHPSSKICRKRLRREFEELDSL